MEVNSKRQDELKAFQNEIGIIFNNIEILNQAFIHPSYTNEHNLQYHLNNQRLEFLGDSVLELVVSNFLFEKCIDFTEGEMTKIRALTVCEPSLAKAARALNLGKYLILGKGEENTGGRNKPSILADTFEALIGAIYVEKGLEVASTFILKNLKNSLEKAINGEWDTDYKTALQEILQKHSSKKIVYKTVREEGPDHDKTFYVNLIWNGKVLGAGSGRSKKEAEQQAAKKAINLLNQRK